MDDSIKTSDMTEHIKLVDHERFWLAWGSDGSGTLFGAQHWQMLKEENGKTRYETVMAVKGVAAHVVKRVLTGMGRDLEASIKELPKSLKRVCEQ